jgi:hypothetical protein
MFAQTSRAPGFIVIIGLFISGCVSQSAPRGGSPALSNPNQPSQPIDASSLTGKTPEDVEEVVWRTPKQPVSRPPRPSVVQWIGPPPQFPAEDNDVESTPVSPDVTANQPTTPAAAIEFDRGVKWLPQTVQDAGRPVLKVDKQPVPSVAVNRQNKITSTLVNPPAGPMPHVRTEPSTMPTDNSVSWAMMNTQLWDKAGKIANDFASDFANDLANSAVDPNRAHPPLAALASPATRPAPPVAVAITPQDLSEAAKLAPPQFPKVLSFASVLEKLPEEARPLAKIGWDQFSIPKTHKWIREQLAGVDLQVAVEIAGVKLIRIPDPKHPDDTVEWDLDLTTQPERFRAFGIDTFNWPATWTVDVLGSRWRGGEVRIPVPEELAKQARFWRIGDTIVLSGTVEDIAVEGGMTNLGQPCGRFTTIFQDVHVERLISQGNQP